MTGTERVRLGAVVDRDTVAARLAARATPLEVTPAERRPPVAGPAPFPPGGAAGVRTAEACWDGPAAAAPVSDLAVAAFALAVAARAAGGPVRLGVLDSSGLRVVEGADGLRLAALSAALDGAPPGGAATVTITTGGPGVTAVPPPEAAGWAVLAVGTPSPRPRARRLPGGDWGLGVAETATLTLTFVPGADAEAAALLDRVVAELERRDWKAER